MEHGLLESAGSPFDRQKQKRESAGLWRVKGVGLIRLFLWMV